MAHLQDKMRELSNDDLGELYLSINPRMDNPITRLNTPENVQWMQENIEGIKPISEWENYNEDDKYIEYDWNQEEPITTSDARDLWGLDADYLDPDFSSEVLFIYMSAEDIDEFFEDRDIFIDFDKYMDDKE